LGNDDCGRSYKRWSDRRSGHTGRGVHPVKTIGIDGWDSAAEAFNITQELVRRGYTEPQIAKLRSGNLLRVCAAVEKTAKKLQKK